MEKKRANNKKMENIKAQTHKKKDKNKSIFFLVQITLQTRKIIGSSTAIQNIFCRE